MFSEGTLIKHICYERLVDEHLGSGGQPLVTKH